MTIKVTYICDRCKKEQLPREQNGGHSPLWTVSVLCEPIDGYRHYYHSPTKYQSVEWCRDCVQELKVMQPLLESLVRQIVREETGQG